MAGNKGTVEWWGGCHPVVGTLLQEALLCGFGFALFSMCFYNLSQFHLAFESLELVVSQPLH